MFFTVMILLTIVLLCGTFFLTAINSAFRRLHRRDVLEQLQGLGNRFYYRKIHLALFSKHEYEGLYLAIICTLNITRFGYIATMLAIFVKLELLQQTITVPYLGGVDLNWLWMALIIFFFILIGFIFGEYLPRLLGAHYPEQALRWCSPFASVYMVLVLPLTYLVQKIAFSLSRAAYLEPTSQPMDRDEFIEFLKESNLTPAFDIHDKKLFESVLRFKERIAREVMVPRVKVFSLPVETSIRDAAIQVDKEGYSRIPIYRNTVDNIEGVLMYKDLLKRFVEFEQKQGDMSIIEAPIETLQKPILHIPETKKLFSLLQEFRKKQVHLAIVVDEYGGTEGIVTIEDILEEIVGEIADEYDQAEQLFVAVPTGDWIADARLNITTADQELGIKIPQEGEYDTIGGYIFHTTGTIPPKGFVIHHHDFDMEILESNDRCVEKVRIRPITRPSEAKETI